MHPIYVNICICDFPHVQTYLQVNSLKVELLSEGCAFDMLVAVTKLPSSKTVLVHTLVTAHQDICFPNTVY